MLSTRRCGVVCWASILLMTHPGLVYAGALVMHRHDRPGVAERAVGNHEFLWTQDSKRQDRGLNETWWIWHDRDMLADPLKRSPMVFTKRVTLDGEIAQASLRISAQGHYALTVNGRLVGEDDVVNTLDWYDIRPFLHRGENEFLVQARTNEWFAGLFVDGSARLPSGDVVPIVSDSSWTVTPMGDDLATAQGPATAAGRIVRGVDGGLWNNCGRLFEFPEPYYRLNLDVTVPGIDWARPYDGPKTVVTAIHPLTRQRDTVELIQRTEMDVAVYPGDVNSGNEKPRREPFFTRIRGLSFADAQANLRAALAAEADVILWGGVSAEEVNGESLFYGTVAEPLKRFVADGGGLVYIERTIPPVLRPTGKKDKKGREIVTKDAAYETELTATPIADPPAFLMQGTPFADLPGFHLTENDTEKGFQKVVRLYRYGKGRVVKLSRVGSQFGLFADRPADNNDLHYQYYLAFAIKCILWGAGQEPAIRFAEFPVRVETAVAEEATLCFRLGEVPDNCGLDVAVRSSEWGTVLPSQPFASQGVERGAAPIAPIWQTQQPVPTGGDVAVAVLLPVLPAGTYFADVQVVHAGRKANWAVAAVHVASPLDIAAMTCDKEYLMLTGGQVDTLAVRVELTAPVPIGTELRMAVLDNYNRVVTTGDRAIETGQSGATAEFRIAEFATTLGRVRAELFVEGQPVAVETASFTTVRRDWDRYTFLGWFGYRETHQDNVYLRILADLGVDAPRNGELSLPWLDAADMVACPGYPAFPRFGAETKDYAQLLRDYAENARLGAETQQRFDPIAFNNGDEFYYRGGEELPGRVVAFREFLQDKYGAIERLNTVWDSSYQSFGEVFPLVDDGKWQKLQKQGNYCRLSEFRTQAATTHRYARLVDQWLGNYHAYNDTARVCLAAIKGVLPAARVGCDCPMWPHATSGHDWHAFLESFDYFAPYGRGGEVIPMKQARSYFRPEQEQFIGLTYGGYLYMAFNRKEELNDVDWQRWRIWNGLFQGFTSLWWYNLKPGASEGNLAPGCEPYPSLAAPARAIDAFRNGIYDLLKPRRVRRDYGPIALHDSVLSRIVVSLTPSDFSGGSYGRNMDVHTTGHLIENELGFDYTFIADPQFPEGALDRYKVLIMPLSLSVGEAQAKALEAFVTRGGVLIADVRPGIFDGSGNWAGSGRVARLFGLSWEPELGRRLVSGPIRGVFLGEPIEVLPLAPYPADPAVSLAGATATATVEGVPLLTVHDVGKGHAICLNTPVSFFKGMTMPDSQYAYWGDARHNAMIVSMLEQVLAILGVERPLRVECPDGEWPYRMNVASLPDGRAHYVGITKGRESDGEGTTEISVRPPHAGNVYDVLTGDCIGQTDRIATTVDSVDVKLFSVLPYRVAGLDVTLSDTHVEPGGRLRGRVRLAFPGIPVRHVINLQATRPDGRVVRYLTRNVELPAGSLLRRGKTVDFELPIALNEFPGEWTLMATDVATRTRTRATFVVGNAGVR